MKYVSLYSRKKNSSNNNTEPGSSQQKCLMLKQLSTTKPPVIYRSNSPTLSELAKSIPNNIIYDKQALYIEVQQLKKIINKLLNENTKLRTKISILQSQKGRLSKSRQKEEIQEKQLFRIHLLSSSSNLKNDNLKNERFKKQIKQLKLDLEAQKNQNIRIKRTLKYAKLNELQLQIKTVIAENKYLYGMYQQACKGKIEKNQFIQSAELENKIQKLAKTNQAYCFQIQRLNMEIMNLQSQLRKERAMRSSKKSSIKNEIPEQKKIAAIKLKEIIDYRRQNSSMIESKIRSVKAKEKLQQTSFKSHHVHVQPIRKNHIFDCNIIQRQQEKKERSLSRLSKPIVQPLENSEKFRPQQGKTERKLVQVQQKFNEIKNTNRRVSDTLTGSAFQKQESNNQQALKLQQISQEKKQSFFLETKNQVIQKVIETQKQPAPQTVKYAEVKLNLKRSHSQRVFEEQRSESNEPQGQIKTQYLKQKVSLSMQARKEANKKAIKELKELLTYRFMYQKYKFLDLKRDIQSSNVKQFSYVDVCHMLINEPFYLNLACCRILAIFIFDFQKPKPQQMSNDLPRHQKMVSMAQLLIKLRKIIKDYSQLTSQKQFTLLQNCVLLMKKHRQQLAQQLQLHKNKNGQNTIELEQLRKVLSNFEFGKQEIEYMVTQVSISSNDLHHIPYEVILDRFSVSYSSKSSKQQIIFQKGRDSHSEHSQHSLTGKSMKNVKKPQVNKQAVEETNKKVSQTPREDSFKNTDTFWEQSHQKGKKNDATSTANIPKS